MATKARISPELRRAIIEAKGSVPEIAVRFQVSEKTVRFWRKRGNPEMSSTRPKSLRGQSLSDFEKRILQEAARLSRYRHLKLIEFLESTLKGVGRAVRSGGLCGEEEPPVSERTSWRYLKDRDLVFKADEYPVPGTVAIHAVSVEWWKGEEENSSASPLLMKGQIIALMERHTGLVFLKAYQKLEPKLIVNAMENFLEIWPFARREVRFVSQLTSAGPRSTALGRANPKPIEEYFDPDEGVVMKTDPPTSKIKGTLPIPGCYPDIRYLNRKLREIANRYNCGDSLENPGKPLEIIWDLYRADMGDIPLSKAKKRTLFTIPRIR